MQFSTVAIGVLALLLLGACGGGPGQRERDQGVTITGVDGRVTIVRPGRNSNTAYTEGLDLKTQGNCAAAVVKLRPVAGIGPGYENAQTALGACLLEIGGKTKELSSDYLDGLTWLRRAGDAGWPEAQGILATAHAFGPATIRNGAEAGYWLALYQTNPTKARIGFMPMAAADVSAIEKSLSTADKEAGAQRAATWERKVWLPPANVQNGPENESGRGDRRRR